MAVGVYFGFQEKDTGGRMVVWGRQTPTNWMATVERKSWIPDGLFFFFWWFRNPTLDAFFKMFFLKNQDVSWKKMMYGHPTIWSNCQIILFFIGLFSCKNLVMRYLLQNRGYHSVYRRSPSSEQVMFRKTVCTLNCSNCS